MRHTYDVLALQYVHQGMQAMVRHMYYVCLKGLQHVHLGMQTVLVLVSCEALQHVHLRMQTVVRRI